MRAVTPPGAVGFLVVGSPRSGTTVVQRLACEIPGVGMPPETHFFTRFATHLLTRYPFPLAPPELTEALHDFAGASHSDGLAIDVDAVVTDMGGTCRRPMDMFNALVHHLAGPADLWGEKTPNHLIWWKPISEAAPWMRFVAVVRDPRAVVASNLEMPWRTDRTLPPWGERMHLAFAELWSFFQGQVLRMARTLGPERSLVLRYEDVVADPDATRARLASFLGRPEGGDLQSVPSGIVLPWESWKTQALGPVGDDRVAAWQNQLDRGRASDIAVVCGPAMRRFAYDGAPSWPATAVGWARIGPLPAARLARYARGRRLHLRTIETYSL